MHARKRCARRSAAPLRGTSVEANSDYLCDFNELPFGIGLAKRFAQSATVWRLNRNRRGRKSHVEKTGSAKGARVGHRTRSDRRRVKERAGTTESSQGRRAAFAV